MRDEVQAYSRYWESGEYVLLDPAGGSDPLNAVIFSQITWALTLIEDTAAGNAIKQAMHANGVPILKEPVGENVIEKATDDMLAAGVHYDEINMRRRQLVEELRQQFRDKQVKPGRRERKEKG